MKPQKAEIPDFGIILSLMVNELFAINAAAQEESPDYTELENDVYEVMEGVPEKEKEKWTHNVVHKNRWKKTDRETVENNLQNLLRASPTQNPLRKEQEMKTQNETQYAIWHRDDSLTSTPEKIGTEIEIIKEWCQKYQGHTGSLNYKIRLADPKARNSKFGYSISENQIIETEYCE